MVDQDDIDALAEFLRQQGNKLPADRPAPSSDDAHHPLRARFCGTGRRWAGHVEDGD